MSTRGRLTTGAVLALLLSACALTGLDGRDLRSALHHVTTTLERIGQAVSASSPGTRPVGLGPAPAGPLVALPQLVGDHRQRA